MNPLDNLASNSKRVLSYVIDDLIISTLFIVIFFDQLSGLATPEDATIFVKNNYWVLVLLKVIYHTLFTWQNGKTVGKHIAKIRSVHIETGELLDLPMSFLRSSVRVLSEAFFYIGFIIAFFSPTRQTMHDRISRSVVVNV
ncbi:MAG: RDD family protein [Sulfurovum sp.]|nr:RDD family protein [Sulfurovum sp.]